MYRAGERWVVNAGWIRVDAALRYAQGGHPLRSVVAGGNTTTLLWCHWRGHPNLAGSSLQSAGVSGWELVPWFVPIFTASTKDRRRERTGERDWLHTILCYL